MTLQTINLGQNPNDGTGDPVRTAFGKTNQNIDELSTRAAAAQATADAAVPQAQKGAAGGVAPLGSDSRIPAAYLPSYVDDVLEFAGTPSFPVVGETGKIYVALDDNRIYRWSAQGYIELSPNPADTDSVSEGDGNLYFTQPRVITALTDNAEAARSALGVYSEGQTIPIFPASNIPSANVGSDIEVQGIGMMSWSATTSRYEMVHYQHGQCQFRYVSATECRLYPFGGNGLVINGRQYRIPQAGVALPSSALIGGQAAYYIYAFDNGNGGIALEAGAVSVSANVHATGVNGVEIRAGDATRTLVGMAYKSASGQFQFDDAVVGVSSWFNRYYRRSTYSLPAASTTSSTFVAMGGALNVWCWAGEKFALYLSGYIYSNTANRATIVGVGINGGGVSVSATAHSAFVNQIVPCSPQYTMPFVTADGFQYATTYIRNDGAGTANFSGDFHLVASA